MDNKLVKSILLVVVVLIALKFALPLLGTGIALIFGLVGNILGLLFVLIPLGLIAYVVYWVFSKNKNQ